MKKKMMVFLMTMAMTAGLMTVCGSSDSSADAGDKGSAKTHYDKAVEFSFARWNHDDEIDEFIAAGKPYEFQDTDEESMLKCILTQKWIANWKLGNEAWADYRRTGYPFLIPVAYNGSNVVDINRGPQRLPYPAAEYTDNLTNVQSAVSNYLNGPDNLATKVWWACKPGL